MNLKEAQQEAIKLGGKVEIVSNDCKCTPDEDGVYHTECDEMFVFEADGPKENSFQFCCFCGKNLVDCTPQE